MLSLLDKGANVNSSDDNGVTALMEASKQGHTDIVRLLLSKGANASARSNRGYNAMLLAKDKPMRELLREAVPNKY